MIELEISDMQSLRRQIRIVTLLNAVEKAGLVPFPILRLHAFAYLTNVLSPVWKMPVMNGKILKRQGGPFYPELQHDIDRLVGLGMVKISGVGHIQDDHGFWRLDGKYRLNKVVSSPVVACLSALPDERAFGDFVQELAYALSALTETELDSAFKEDATYSDPITSADNVVDFSDRNRNFSVNAAEHFDSLQVNRNISPGERLHLYVAHLHRRLHRAG